MTPEEARRLVAAEEQAQHRYGARLVPQDFRPAFCPPWTVEVSIIGWTTYCLGPIHGPKFPWAATQRRAGERKAEAQVLALQGLGVREIAERLCVTPVTVRKYLAPPPPPAPPTPLWRLPRAKRRAERAKRRRLGMLAWAERSAAHAA